MNQHELRATELGQCRGSVDEGEGSAWPRVSRRWTGRVHPTLVVIDASVRHCPFVERQAVGDLSSCLTWGRREEAGDRGCPTACRRVALAWPSRRRRRSPTDHQCADHDQSSAGLRCASTQIDPTCAATDGRRHPVSHRSPRPSRGLASCPSRRRSQSHGSTSASRTVPRDDDDDERCTRVLQSRGRRRRRWRWRGGQWGSHPRLPHRPCRHRRDQHHHHLLLLPLRQEKWSPEGQQQER